MRGKKLFTALLPAIIILILGFTVSAIIYFTSHTEPTYTVTFCDEKNEVISTVKAKEGEPAKAPEMEPKANAVFKGWNVDLSNVTEDMEARPVYNDLSKDVNAIYIDTYYEESGEEFWVEVKMAGEINLASVDLGIAFDSDTLKFLGYDGLSHTKETNVEEKKDYLVFPMEFEEVPKQGDSILKLKFQCKNKHLVYTDLPIDISNAKTLLDGVLQPADVTSVKGNIYIY